jgi:Yip1-like protein
VKLNSLAARLYGVIRRPRATFAATLPAPSWVAVLVVTTTITFLSSLGFLSTDVGRQALVDQWERTATAFGQTVDDAAYARMEERAGNGGIGLLYSAATALGYGPVLVFVVAAGLFLVLKPRRPFVEVLTIASYSTVILALRQVIATPIDYVRESIASPTTLVQFFGMLDEASPMARFLGVIDLFIVWWIVVLAIGISVLYRRPTRSLALTLAGAYVVLALLAALVMAVSGGTA